VGGCKSKCLPWGVWIFSGTTQYGMHSQRSFHYFIVLLFINMENVLSFFFLIKSWKTCIVTRFNFNLIGIIRGVYWRQTNFISVDNRTIITTAKVNSSLFALVGVLWSDLKQKCWLQFTLDAINKKSVFFTCSTELKLHKIPQKHFFCNMNQPYFCTESLEMHDDHLYQMKEVCYIRIYKMDKKWLK